MGKYALVAGKILLSAILDVPLPEWIKGWFLHHPLFACGG